MPRDPRDPAGKRAKPGAKDTYGQPCIPAQPMPMGKMTPMPMGKRPPGMFRKG